MRTRQQVQADIRRGAEELRRPGETATSAVTEFMATEQGRALLAELAELEGGNPSIGSRPVAISKADAASAAAAGAGLAEIAWESIVAEAGTAFQKSEDGKPLSEAQRVDR